MLKEVEGLVKTLKMCPCNAEVDATFELQEGNESKYKK